MLAINQNVIRIWGVLVAGRTDKRARSDFAQVQILELEIFLSTPCQRQRHEVKKAINLIRANFNTTVNLLICVCCTV